MSTAMFKLYERSYKVVAEFPMSEIDKANAYMDANRDVGVLAVDAGRVILVKLNDKGVILAEVAA
jgi:hypothetical protein